MPVSTAFATALNNLLYNNANIANLGDATGVRGSSVAGNFYIAAHTASPGAAGNQSTNECTYSGYARVAVARSASGFTVSNASVSNAGVIQLPQNTGGSPQTITHISVGFQNSGAGMIFRYAALATPYVVQPNTTPEIAIGALVGALSLS